MRFSILPTYRFITFDIALSGPDFFLTIKTDLATNIILEDIAVLGANANLGDSHVI
jgi:hypothetical protein